MHFRFLVSPVDVHSFNGFDETVIRLNVSMFFGLG